MPYFKSAMHAFDRHTVFRPRLKYDSYLSKVLGRRICRQWQVQEILLFSQSQRSQDIKFFPFKDTNSVNCFKQSVHL